jgi:signal peptidase I
MPKQRKIELEDDAGLEALEACRKAPKRRKTSSKTKKTDAIDALESSKSAPKRRKTSKVKPSARKSSKKGSSRKRQTQPVLAVRIIAAALLILMLGTIYCLEFSRVTSNAMMPTLAKGDWVVSWAPRWIHVGYEPGDVVWVNASESDVAPNFLRLIAQNDAEISYNNDTFRINGISPERRLLTNDAIIRPPEEPEIWRETLTSGVSWRIMLPQQGLYGANSGRVDLKNNDMFLIGDNRMASYDSRQRGVYSRDQVQGRALFILASARDDALLGHWIKPL